MAGEEREPLLGHGHNNSRFIVEQDAVESDIPTVNPHDPAEGAALQLGEERRCVQLIAARNACNLTSKPDGGEDFDAVPTEKRQIGALK